MGLRIVHDTEPARSTTASSAHAPDSDSNLLNLWADGCTELAIYSFKTNITYGCNRLRLSPHDFVDRQLRTFIKDFRPKLLMQVSHNFLFINLWWAAIQVFSIFYWLHREGFRAAQRQPEVHNNHPPLVTLQLADYYRKERRRGKSVARLMSHTVRMQKLRFNTM